IYYETPTNGDPGTLASATWSAVWAETHDATAPKPTWTVTTLEDSLHTGAICAASGCSGDNRFAGDFINAIFDSHDVAHLTWMSEGAGTGGTATILSETIPEGPKQANTPLCTAPTAATAAVAGR